MAWVKIHGTWGELPDEEPVPERVVVDMGQRELFSDACPTCPKMHDQRHASTCPVLREE